ncbi:MAG: PAS domain S-box protein, partial [Chitinophagaceae bacterium]
LLDNNGQLVPATLTVSWLGDTDLPNASLFLIHLTSPTVHHHNASHSATQANAIPFLNNTGELIWSVTRSFHLIAGNKTFFAEFSKRTGRSIKPGDYLLPDELPKDVRLFWHTCYTRALGETFSQELFSPAQGWLEVTFHPLYNGNNLIGISCYCRNVTSHKQQEEKIKGSETSLALAQSLAKIGSWETEVQHFDLKWSEETAHIFELIPEESGISYQQFLNLVYKEDRSRVHNAFKRSLLKDGHCYVEHRLRTASGMFKVIEQRWQIIRDDKGLAVKVHGTCQDITERRNFEEALRQSEEKYRILFDASPMAILIYDLDTFKVQDVNLAAINHYGYSREEFLKLSLQDLRPARERHVPKKVERPIIQKEGFINFGIITHLKKDGTQIKVEVVGSKITYQAKECMMVVCNDVTQRETTLEMLLDRESKLRQAHEIAKLGHWHLDITTQKIDWSDEVYKIWDIDILEQPSFETFLSTIHPEDRDSMLGAHIKALEQNLKDLDLEFRIILRNGVVKWVHEIGSLQYNEQSGALVFSGTVQDITPQKLLAISLEESNTRYQLVTRATSDAIWDWDLVHDNIYWGDGIEYIFGHAENALNGPGDIWLANIHPDDKERVVQSMSGFLKTTQNDRLNWEEEYRFKRGNGEYAAVADKGFLIKDEKGRNIRMVGAMQDVTKRKESEEAIRRSIERFELIGKAANDAVWEWNTVTDEGWANLTHQEMFGLTLNDPVPVRSEWINRLHKDDRTAVLQSYQDAADTRMAMWYGEYRMRTENKGWISVYDRTYMEYDEAGNVTRKIGSLMDITRRKQEEQHLKLLESVIINANDAVVITEVGAVGDPTATKIIYVNQAFTKMTGYSDAEILGQSPTILQGPATDADEVAKLNDALANFRFFETTLVNYKKNGQAFWVNFSVSPVANDNGWYTHWIAIQREVTAQKLAELHLNSLNEKLQQHVRALAISNAELEQFAFVASHDLQEPLRMVTGFVTQLEKKYAHIIDDRGKQYIAFAVDGARRMRQIILDLLEYSKVGRAEQPLETIALDDLIAEILILFRAEIEQKNIQLQVPKLPVVHGHPAPLRQVFQNLIGNALKYIRKDVVPQVTISVKETITEFEFCIADNGIGIEKEYHEKIFIIFQRLHPRGDFSGTGIGLAITKKIIENMGGRIWIASVAGQGSSFYFTLPKKTANTPRIHSTL